MTETLTIERLGRHGDGIAEGEGKVIFVPFSLPGEIIRAEIRNDGGRIREVVDSHPDRVEPICRHFTQCGGCALQHMSDTAQARFKVDQVTAALATQGIDVPVEDIATIPANTRRRAVFAARRIGKRVVFGFSERASNRITDIAECPVLVPQLASQLAGVRAIADLVAGPRGDTRLTVLWTETGSDIAVSHPAKDWRSRESKIVDLAIETDLARLTVTDEIVVQQRAPTLLFEAVHVVPPPSAFVQASAEAEMVMAEIVTSALGGAGRVADLFSGIGTFALRVAKTATVHAVEGDADALTALQNAANHAAGLKPITVERRDLMKSPLQRQELRRFDAVIFDPPRAGARAQAEMLAESDVPIVVTVSCNPSTLARDARILIDGGCKLATIHPVDQFRHTPHIEVVAVFRRKD